ncbi:MAG: phage tail tape measure protein, partial [Dehalococcoidales bacterium]|nr:phage tail tape measure protein [Dehalococcoidales bacterium]
MSSEIGKLFVTIGSDISGFQKGWNTVQGRLKGIGAGMTAAGAAGLKMIDSAREINSQLAQVALTVGSTTGELRNMVMETANVTFGIDSVTKTFDLLSKAGITNETQMKASANAFDALADATGSSAEVMADMLIPAFKNLGVAIPTSSNELDKFTWLSKNTTVQLTDFASAMDYVAAYGSSLNLTLDDMVAIMAALEAKGITGSAVTRVFRTAVSQAADGAVTLNEALGLTQQEVDGFKQKMGEASGITDEYAAAANTQYGIMDKLKFQWSKIQLAVGSALTPLESMFALMTALGPVMIFLGSSAGKSALAFIGHAAAVVRSNIATATHAISSRGLALSQGIEAGTAGAAATAQTTLAVATAAGIAPAVALKVAQDALNASMKAFPLWAIIAAIAAAVAGIIYLVKHWDQAKNSFQQANLNIKNAFLAMTDGILDKLQKLSGGIPPLQSAIQAFRDKITDMFGANQVKLEELKVERAWMDLQKKVKESKDSIVSDAKMATQTMINSSETAATQAIQDAQNVRDKEKEALEDRKQFYRDLTEDRLTQIDKQMVAELAAMNPDLGEKAQAYLDLVEQQEAADKERQRGMDEDRLKDLQAERNLGKAITGERREEMEKQLADLNDELDNEEDLTRERRKDLKEQIRDIQDQLNEDLTDADKRTLDDQIADIEDKYAAQDALHNLWQGLMAEDTDKFFGDQQDAADTKYSEEVDQITANRD